MLDIALEPWKFSVIRMWSDAVFRSETSRMLNCNQKMVGCCIMIRSWSVVVFESDGCCTSKGGEDLHLQRVSGCTPGSSGCGRKL